MVRPAASARPVLGRGVLSFALLSFSLLSLSSLTSTLAAPADNAAAGGASPAPVAPRLSLKAELGFYDDAWALDDAGKRLVVIHTNRDDFQRLEIFDLDTQVPTPSSSFDLSPPSRVPQSLSFLPEGAGLLLVSAGPSPDTQFIETMDAAGKPLGRTGPISAFGTAARGNERLLVTLERRPGRSGEMTYVVSALSLPSLKPSGKPRNYLVGKDGTLRAAGLVPVGFFDGYSKLLAQRPGWYDKKKDARQPDAQAVLDLLSGKSISSAPIDDVYGWARTTRLRREHPNRIAFVQLADALGVSPDTKTDGKARATGVELVDGSGRVSPLPLAVPFRLYDRFTLKDQEGPAQGMIHFALQVDPVNPDAVARKKADQPALDVYSVVVARPETARLRARVSMDTQPVAWSVAADRVVVLRRFKNFVRGGDRLDVYDLRP